MAEQQALAGENRQPKVGAAFFDVDGTVLRVNSASRYIWYLRREGLIGFRDFAMFVWGFVTYRLGVVNLERMARLTSRWIQGRPEQDIIDHCVSWYADEIRSTIRPEIRTEIAKHKAAGRMTVILTSGTRYLNDLIAEELGFDHVVATELEVKDGLFTGDPIPPICYGKGKLAKARRFATQHGVSFADSYFYTDSISDLPVLLEVGHPVIVGPDPPLRVQARRRGWPLLAAETPGAHR